MNKYDLPLIKTILDEIQRLSTPQYTQHLPWHKSSVHSKSGGICSYCSASIDTSKARSGVINFLVPLHLGGPNLDENKLLACNLCASSKGHNDLLGWENFTKIVSKERQSVLLDLRFEILKRSSNHLLHTAQDAKNHLVLNALKKRFAHPRSRVFALHSHPYSFIGWTKTAGSPVGLVNISALVKNKFGGIYEGEGGVHLWRIASEKFYDCVWSLIDLHTICVPFTVPMASTIEGDEKHWASHWDRFCFTFGQLRRRKPNGQTYPSPRKPVALSEDKLVKARRDRYRLRAINAQQIEYENARREFQIYLSRVGQGQAKELSFIERRRWEFDIERKNPRKKYDDWYTQSPHLFRHLPLS